jgi:CRP-like cAMP-binding protein
VRETRTLQWLKPPAGRRGDRNRAYPPTVKNGTVIGGGVRRTPMQSVAFKAGETIIREGDDGDTAFVIVSGEVEVLVGAGGRRVGTLGTGEVFGEMCLIEPGPRSASIVALTDVDCLVTTYEEFTASIEDHPERALAFMKTLVRRLRQMNELMERIDPNRRGLRGIVRECQKAIGPAKVDPEVAQLSWTMLW